MKKCLFFVLPLALSLVLSACGNDDTASKTEPEPPQVEQPQQPEQTEPAAEPEEQKETFKYTTPLTGMGTNDELPKRVIMVMVNNDPKARPQSGLDKADIVYEVLAEGSITRFVGIYHSDKPKVIGPVRSIRSYYIDIGSGFDAIMVHAGGSPAALATLGTKGMASFNEIGRAGPYFWRESFRKAPHNLYTDLDKIWDGSQKLGFRMEAEVPQLTFKDPEEEAKGTEAKNVEISYTSQYVVGYEYDSEQKLYKRITSGQAHKDLTTDEQLTAVNVMVLATPHKILDQAGRRDVNVFGPGKGYLFQQGKAQEITWERKGGLIRAYIDGKEVQMYPGNTWVNIIPSVPSLSEAVKFQ
ncbi:DUF3048 domain-containing protein [Ammoniphilus sp. CFH 90114]|uniref:DUF3048 domain-containing protein n=1 Tax=Ammoniphilus sp. CFH 90114 TaxID=2493665 RepID=UPI0013E951D2|nr:DUF3048 domain-containing protein [Ammoniphilus sp. CFH 90114]